MRSAERETEEEEGDGMFCVIYCVDSSRLLNCLNKIFEMHLFLHIYIYIVYTVYMYTMYCQLTFILHTRYPCIVYIYVLSINFLISAVVCCMHSFIIYFDSLCITVY